MANGTYDVITVGGGMGGSAFALAMADHGARVLVLEREQHFRDRVRGEGMHAWGVPEARALGIYERLRETCGVEVRWWDTYLRTDRIDHQDFPATTPHHSPLFDFYHPEMGDVSQVLMCYSPRVSLQLTTCNMIEWPHDCPGVALSSLSRDRHRAPWSDPARQATVPMPRTTLCGADVSAGVELPRAIACSQRAERRDGPECQWDS